MIIISYIKDGGILKIIANNRKSYTYFDVNPRFKEQIEKLIKQYKEGDAWRLLRNFAKKEYLS